MDGTSNFRPNITLLGSILGMMSALNSKHFAAFILLAACMLLIAANFCKEPDRSRVHSNYIEELKVKTRCIEAVDLERMIGSEAK